MRKEIRARVGEQDDHRAPRRIEIYARITGDGKRFFCNHCGGQVHRMPGERPRYPFVMFCPACKAVRGEWDSGREREDYLRDLPASPVDYEPI